MPRLLCSVSEENCLFEGSCNLTIRNCSSTLRIKQLVFEHKAIDLFKVLLLILLVVLLMTFFYNRVLKPRGGTYSFSFQILFRNIFFSAFSASALLPPRPVELGSRCPSVLVLYTDDCPVHSDAVLALCRMLEESANAKCLVDQWEFAANPSKFRVMGRT